MWRKATVLPAGTQVACCLSLVLLTSVPAAVAPISTGSTNQSAVFSPDTGSSPGVGASRKPICLYMSAVLCVLLQVGTNVKC